MAKKEKAEVTQVGPMDPKKKNSLIKEGPPPAETHGQGETKATACWFNGVQYSPGAAVCSGGRLLVCYDNGVWSHAGAC